MRKLFIRVGVGGIVTLMSLYTLGLIVSYKSCSYAMDYVKSQKAGKPTSAGQFPKVVCAPFIMPGILAGAVTSVLDTEEDVQTPNQAD